MTLGPSPRQPLKTFLVFGGEFYPRPGLADFRGSFDDLNEAIDYAKGIIGQYVSVIEDGHIYTNTTVEWVAVYSGDAGNAEPVFTEHDPGNGPCGGFRPSFIKAVVEFGQKVETLPIPLST